MEHFLHFTKGERIGILVLMLLCLGLFIVPSYLSTLSQTEQTDFTELEADINRWYQSSESETEEKELESINFSTSVKATAFDPNHVSREQLQAHHLPKNTIRAWLSYTKKGGYFNKIKDLENFRALATSDLEKISSFLIFSSNQATVVENREEKKTTEINYFSFDPKKVTKEELISLGLSEKIAYNWTKYTANGGFFNKASDIQKIYGLSERDYQRLLPYVDIKETSSAPIASNGIPRSYENTDRIPVVIDINKANAEQWQELRGIGPAFSKRIVNFRDKLGGFHSVHQVAETYGLPDSVFQKIQLSLRPSPILQQLAINKLSEKELATHPYISYNDAKVIVQYRANHGAFSSAADLEKLYALEAATIRKISPYLSF